MGVAVDGGFHTPAVGGAGVQRMGAGIAAQTAFGVLGHQEGGTGQHAPDVFLHFLQGGRVVLESSGGVGDVPVVQLHHRGGVGFIGQADGDFVVGGPGIGQGFLFGAGELFQRRFPAQGGAFVGAALGVGQFGPAFHAGIPGAGAPGVAAQAAGQVVGPAGVQAAVAAADHVGPGGGGIGSAAVGGAGAFAPGRVGVQIEVHSLTGLPAARRARRQASTAWSLSSAVTRNRLGWQNRRPRPLFWRRTSSGWPAQAGGKGTLLRRVL